VHKKVIWVAVRLPGEAPGERTVVTRSFTTFWRQWTTPSFLEAVTSGKVGTHAITEAASR